MTEKVCSVTIQETGTTIPCDLTINNTPVSEIAHANGSELVLSYEDVINTFGLFSDVYTTAHHHNLIAHITTSGMPHVSLFNALPYEAQHREFLRPTDLSLRLKCEMQMDCFPLFEPAFSLSMGNMAFENTSQAKDDGMILWLNYLWQGLNIELLGVQIFKPEAALMLMQGLLMDADTARSQEIKAYFESKGCADFERDRMCIEEGSQLSAEDGKKFVNTPKCLHFLEDVKCTYDQMQSDLLLSIQQMRDKGLTAYRQSHASNTYTTFERAKDMHSVIRFLGETRRDIISHPVNILIIGPGLETVNPYFGISFPSQTFEPFILADAVLGTFEVPLGELSISLLDINPRVIKHLSSAVDAAQQNKQYHFASKVNGIKPFSGFLDHLPRSEVSFTQDSSDSVTVEASISPQVVNRMHPILGDISTDRLEGSYDLVVIMNTFMYMSPLKRFMAIENIARTLKPNGILLTDIDTSALPQSEVCNLLTDTGLVPVLTIPGSQPKPFVVWKRLHPQPS